MASEYNLFWERSMPSHTWQYKPGFYQQRVEFNLQALILSLVTDLPKITRQLTSCIHRTSVTEVPMQHTKQQLQ